FLPRSTTAERNLVPSIDGAASPSAENAMFVNRFATRVRRLRAAGLLAVVLSVPAPSPAQVVKGGDQAKQPDFIPAGYDDYQNMLSQLDITKIRRGRDARVADTSDEATANRYKDSMPELLTFKDGTKVTEASQWPRRRAEIVEDFEREVYGRV